MGVDRRGSALTFDSRDLWPDGNVYEFVLDVVDAANPGRVFAHKLMTVVPGFQTPEAAARSVRGVWRRLTKDASEAQPITLERVRCTAPVALEIASIRRLSPKESNDYLEDHFASFDILGRGDKPSFEALRRARKTKRFKRVK